MGKRRLSDSERAANKKACMSAWHKANPDKVAARGVRYRAKNREKDLARKRLYRIRHSQKINALTAYHRALRLKATPVWANRFFISEAYDLAKLRTKVTGIRWHVDHIVPLKSAIVCGLHVEQNLQVIPAARNQSKGNFYWPDMPMATEMRAAPSVS